MLNAQNSIELAKKRLNENPAAVDTARGGIQVDQVVVGDGREFVAILVTKHNGEQAYDFRHFAPHTQPSSVTVSPTGHLSFTGNAERTVKLAQTGWLFFRPKRRYGYVNRQGQVDAIFWSDLNFAPGARTLVVYSFVASGIEMPPALKLAPGESQAWMTRFWQLLHATSGDRIVDISGRLEDLQAKFVNDGVGPTAIEVGHTTFVPALGVSRTSAGTDSRLEQLQRIANQIAQSLHSGGGQHF